MATGLIALLDDIAALAKGAAATLDGAGAQAAKAGAKAAGVVIDDTAVTPAYVTGFTADRELPIIGKIALGSLRNKLLILLPGALLLSWAAPWAITPLLMLGGVYLCYEGAEKLAEKLWPHEIHEGDAPAGATPAEVEAAKIKSAVQTDFILSAEIMAITLGSVAALPFATRAFVLAAVGIGITALVYGVVALIVKADDMGVALARSRGGAGVQAFGRGLVHAMPPLLRILGGIGTAAMLWVGGGIVIHGLEVFGWGAPEHGLESAAAAARSLGLMPPVLGWAAGALASGVFGLALGAAAVAVRHVIGKR